MAQQVVQPKRKRLIEIISAGCVTCEETVNLVRQLACESCEVKILDMKDREVVALAKSVGVRSVPTVMVTSGKLAACCAAGAGPDEATLRRLGVGQPTMTGRKRVVEIFSAGCAACEEAIGLVRRIACDSCEIKVLDMRDREVAALAKGLAVRQVPTVVIASTEFADGRGPEASALKAAGVGQPILLTR